jgi:hypothetical protein
LNSTGFILLRPGRLVGLSIVHLENEGQTMAIIQVGINRSIGEHQRAHLPLRIRFSIEADRTRQATSGLPSSPALSRQSQAMKIEFSTTVRVFMRSQLRSSLDVPKSPKDLAELSLCFYGHSLFSRREAKGRSPTPSADAARTPAADWVFRFSKELTLRQLHCLQTLWRRTWVEAYCSGC